MSSFLAIINYLLWVDTNTTFHIGKERIHLMKDKIVIAVMLPQKSTSLPVKVELDVQSYYASMSISKNVF